MILQITEYCKWENERWGYLIDIDKQDAVALTYLFTFMQMANDLYKHIKDNNTGLFAASNYHVVFYDKGMQEEHKITLISSSHRIVCKTDESGYNFRTNVRLDKLLAPSKIYSFMLAMRDKQENHLYKNFDEIFL